MKCSHCNSPAQAIGSALNGNGELLFTNYMCHACNKRFVKSALNPCYVAKVKIVKAPERKPYTKPKCMI